MAHSRSLKSSHTNSRVSGYIRGKSGSIPDASTGLFLAESTEPLIVGIRPINHNNSVCDRQESIYPACFGGRGLKLSENDQRRNRTRKAMGQSPRNN